MLDLYQFDPRWTLPSLMMRNPLVWMLETTSGMIVDVRHCSRAEQVSAFEAGLIPFVPADVPGADEDPVAAQVEAKPERAADVVARISPGTRKRSPL